MANRGGVYRRVHYSIYRGTRKARLGITPLSIGDRYIVAAGAINAWSGKDNQIAEWDGSSWVFTVPKKGYTLYIDDENQHYKFNGSIWEII